MSKKLQITLTRSVIGSNEKQRNTLTSLGLKRINDVVEKEDSPSLRGMLTVVSHLVTVEETE